MATFHAFCGNLRVATPPYTDDGISFIYQVAADVLILDEDDVVLIPGGADLPADALRTYASQAAFEHGDTIASLREKALTNLRGYYPQIDPSDTLIEHWLADGDA